ncbi:MAG: hypothetical protein JWM74_4607 [Myxococcaceae bacterium]|nr:hypothetical protein [Myxococcaceae bacterium]
MPCKTVATRARYRRRAATILFVAGATCALERRASAEPLRLRGDAIADTRAPAGLIVLEGRDKVRPWFDVEGLVWAGARSEAAADVLVLSFRLRDARRYTEFRGGRFVVATGAVRPVQIDGAWAIGRTAFGSTLETFGGVPVVPRLQDRAYDWLVGGRVAQSVASRATFGVSYVQRRRHGELADDEVGGDFATAPTPWLDVAARGAYDLASPGVAEALASVAARSGAYRVELFGSHRSPSRLLPATSLFSVLGDFPSQMIGGTVRWQAAPRLDLFASGAGQLVGGELGMNTFVRALLRTDDRGEGNVGLELRRQDVSLAQWTGVRAVGTEPLGHGFRASTELELSFADHPAARGAVWPWALVALGWRSSNGWEIASALEAAATPQHSFETNALMRVSRAMAF